MIIKITPITNGPHFISINHLDHYIVMLGHIVMILWIEVSDFAVWEIPSIEYKKMRKVYNASTVNQI